MQKQNMRGGTVKACRYCGSVKCYCHEGMMKKQLAKLRCKCETIMINSQLERHCIDCGSIKE